jgi:hypothetical protein
MLLCITQDIFLKCDESKKDKKVFRLYLKI